MKPVVLITVLITLLILGAGLYFYFQVEGSESATGDAPESVSALSSTMQKKPQRTAGSDKINHSEIPEDDLAVPVPGDPTLVTLTWRPDLGPISIERVTRNGDLTGKPLKSGTKVQIPDPENPGDRIIFTVP
ncbi:MAG: hypothetical protein P1V20_11960 [Verrucomicrobiales bacterium]|nr:hypothetical protein [Verrucomicrobiales bacterium]